MTQEIMNPTADRHISADRADRLTAWWPRSLQSQIASRTDRDQIEASIKLLREPCDPAWLMARVLALLAPYFASNIPEGVRRIEAEDWRAALQQWPAWAIEKACRWWKSDENPDHRRKPLEGDIVERVRFELGVLSFGVMKVREYDDGYKRRMEAPEQERPTESEMALRRKAAQDLVENLGFAKAARPTAPMRTDVTEADLAEWRATLAAKGIA
jgi:hypothetical protein